MMYDLRFPKERRGGGGERRGRKEEEGVDMRFSGHISRCSLLVALVLLCDSPTNFSCFSRGKKSSSPSTSTMADIRGRRRPGPADEDQTPLINPQPPSILRQNSSPLPSSKKTRFSPDTVFHCRHLRYRRAKIRTFVMLTVLGVIVGVSFWLTYGVMAEHQRQAIEEMRAAANNGGGTTNQHDLNLNGGRGQVRPGALGSFTAGHDGHDAAPKEAAHEPSATVNEDRCEFRKYPPNRLYGNNNKQQPDFYRTQPTFEANGPLF